VCGKIALSPFAMSAARAVKRLIAGVVEAAFAWLDLGLTVRFGASGRTANRDPLGIGFEPASHKLLPPFVFARIRSCGRACCASLSIAANCFPRGPLERNWRARA